MRLVILTALFLVLSDPAAACSCGRRPSALEALPIVTEVFEGTALSRSPFLARIDGSFTVLERTEFEVHQAWRGSSERRLTLVTGFGNCDYLFQVGAVYVVFALPADRPELGLSSSICLPTTSVGFASTVLAELGPGLSVSPVPSSWDERRLVRLSRVVRSALLWGVASSLSVFARPEYIPRPPLSTCLPGPLAALSSAVLFAVLCARRRSRLAGVLLVPLLLLVFSAFTAQGFRLILSSPLLSHWILKPFYGV